MLLMMKKFVLIVDRTGVCLIIFEVTKYDISEIDHISGGNVSRDGLRIAVSPIFVNLKDGTSVVLSHDLKNSFIWQEECSGEKLSKILNVPHVENL